MSKRLYLVDGSTYIFRAFYAIRSLTTSEGLPTNAVYGFTSMLLKLIRQEKPDYLAVVFDASGRSFRNDIYPQYKANRPPPPEDLVPQFPLVREVTRGFNIPALELLDYEADDIIATLATRAADEGLDVTIVSTDKDLMQLVGGRCTMLDTMKDVRYGPDEVREKMGVAPEQIVDFLALMGDKVDNIPGVPGIGKKTAAQLLGDYSTLDGVYAALEEQKGKRRENLEQFRDDAYLSQTLATVERNVPVPFDLDDLRVSEPDRAALTELFARLEFKSWQREFHDADAEVGEAEPLGREGFRLVQTEEQLASLARALKECPCFAFDTETTSLTPVDADLVGLSFATDREHAWYVPVGHRGLDAGPQLPLARALEVLGAILADPELEKTAQNGKYDIQVLRRHGVTLKGLAFDTMLASYLLDADKYQHNLDNIALDWLNHKTIKFSDVAGKTGKDQLTFDMVELERAKDYACEDAQVVWALKELMEPRLEEAGLRGLHDDLELPLSLVLADMETNGVRVDVPYLEELSRELGSRAAQLEREAHEAAGRPFTLGSPKQLSAILFDEIGLEPLQKTKTGFSTKSAVLEALQHEHPLPRLVLDWRTVTKLKSTYTDVLPKLVSRNTGRIHTSFNQAVAATGRLSSADPNLQNIPIRTEEGRRIREAFVPADGHLLISADYSQIELRVLAHLCGSQRMQRAFADGADIHRRTASELFGTPEDAVTREERAMAKTVNFGILYGMSAFRLAREQGISRAEAKGIIDRYFERYPKIGAWKEATIAEARETGHVRTLLGRVRRVADIRSKNHQVRSAAERVAVNTPVQGTAADIIKVAMIRIHRRLQGELPEAKMLLQVHDELVLEAPSRLVPEVSELVKTEMEQVLELGVPLTVNVASGSNWLEAH